AAQRLQLAVQGVECAHRGRVALLHRSSLIVGWVVVRTTTGRALARAKGLARAPRAGSEPSGPRYAKAPAARCGRRGLSARQLLAAVDGNQDHRDLPRAEVGVALELRVALDPLAHGLALLGLRGLVTLRPLRQRGDGEIGLVLLARLHHRGGLLGNHSLPDP